MRVIKKKKKKSNDRHSAAEREGNNLQDLEYFDLEMAGAKARIRPRRSCLCRIRQRRRLEVKRRRKPRRCLEANSWGAGGASNCGRSVVQNSGLDRENEEEPEIVNGEEGP